MAEPGKDTRYRVVLGVGVGALVLDQLTKLWVMASLPYYGAVTVIPGFFDLVNIRNRGAAFGFLNRSDIEWQFWLFFAATLVSAGVIFMLDVLAQLRGVFLRALGAARRKAAVLGAWHGARRSRGQPCGPHPVPCRCGFSGFLCRPVALARVQRGGHRHLLRRAARLPQHVAERSVREGFVSLFSLEWWQIALLFLPALLNLWGIWHAFNHTFETPLERVLWMVACVFVPVLGGVAYVLFGWRRAH